MSDTALFALCFLSGALARTAFLPATLVAKKCSLVPTLVCDIFFSFVGGLPFMALVLYFRDGVHAYFTLAAFYAGLLVPTLIGTLIRRRRDGGREKIPDKESENEANERRA